MWVKRRYQCESLKKVFLDCNPIGIAQHHTYFSTSLKALLEKLNFDFSNSFSDGDEISNVIKIFRSLDDGVLTSHSETTPVAFLSSFCLSRLNNFLRNCQPREESLTQHEIKREIFTVYREINGALYPCFNVYVLHMLLFTCIIDTLEFLFDMSFEQDKYRKS